MASPILEFNYDISCPFAYIASTRVSALAERAGATLIWRPVLLGAIYRATSAPQGAAGSASDVFNLTKKAVTARSMKRTLKRYQILYNPPPEHPQKTVNALRLLCYVSTAEREVLSKALFRAYWVEGRNVSNSEELLQIAREAGIKSAETFLKDETGTAAARKALEEATADAIDRGAFGVPGFWLPDEKWTDFTGEKRHGRFYWGQDRIHFVEASLLALRDGRDWHAVPGLRNLLPRCIGLKELSKKVRVEFWYDFSSPWGFLGWTQLDRLRRTFGPNLEIVLKPFLLGILFREIGAPNTPSTAVSPQKALWSRHDHNDWVRFWNAVNVQEGQPDKTIDFYWADIFPIRTPATLRSVLVEPSTAPTLYRACWEQNKNVADESILIDVLNKGGYDGPRIVKEANGPEIKDQLRKNTAEAKEVGLCGAPSYRVFHHSADGNWVNEGGVVWGQDEINVVEDLIAGWDDESPSIKAEVRAADNHKNAWASRL